MRYILIDDFNDNINIIRKDDGSGETLIFDSFEAANEQLEEQCQNGIVVPIGSDRLFTKAEILDVLISFAQSMYPEDFNSSKELSTYDFLDAPICKASQLGLEKEFNIAVEKYANGSDEFFNNYKIDDLL